MYCQQRIMERHFPDKCPVFFAHADVLQVRTFRPFTHLFAFNIGMPPDVMQHIAKVFNREQSAHHLVCFVNAHSIIDEYGFHVQLIDQIGGLKMTGPGEGRTCYFYVRVPPVADKPQRRVHTLLERLPTPPAFDRIEPHQPSYAHGLEAFGRQTDYIDWVRDQVNHKTMGDTRLRPR